MLTHGKSMFVYSFGSVGELLYKVFFLPKPEGWGVCSKWRELDRPMREFVNSYLLRWAHAKLSWNMQCLWFCNMNAWIYPKVSWDSPSPNNVLSIEGQPRIPRPRTRPTSTSNIRKIYSRRNCLEMQTYSAILPFLSTWNMHLCLVSACSTSSKSAMLTNFWYH